MNQKEVVDTLLVQAKIEPGFTELVWQKLEEENREFFKAYHVRLMVKHQIMILNELLEKQVELMRKTCPVGVGTLSMSNGSSLNQNPCFMTEQRVQPSRPENMHHPVAPSTTIRNGVHGNMQSSDDSSARNGRLDISQNMLPTHEMLGMIQVVNRIVVKSESGYSNSSPFTFGLDGNVLDTRPTIVDASVASYSEPQGDNKRLGTISEGLSFDEFGSE